MLPLYSARAAGSSRSNPATRIKIRSRYKQLWLSGYGAGILLLVFVACLILWKDTQTAVRQETASDLRHESFRVYPAAHLRTLVLVAGHSVYTGLDYHESGQKDSWYLMDYQKKVAGQTNSFLQHIQLGVEAASADPDALLMFSGGKTRREAGPRAEGESYWLVAEAQNWFGFRDVRDRAYTEEKARDSFENLLFGLCRFFELTGHAPDSITVVGYKFKEARFRDLHRAALSYPRSTFTYIGTEALTHAARDGESSVVSLFEKDPYGCKQPLNSKRMERDPFAEGGYAPDRCPQMAGLLDWCGPEIYNGPVPWTIGN